MKDLVCNILDSETNKKRVSIKVHLDFDVPEEMLKTLGTLINNSFKTWHNTIILHKKLER